MVEFGVNIRNREKEPMKRSQEDKSHQMLKNLMEEKEKEKEMVM